MSEVIDVGINELISSASKVARLANEMQTSIQIAYNTIISMSDSWFGRSYDNYATAANLTAKVFFNDLFTNLVSDVPHEIAAKAKTYAVHHQEEITSTFTDQIAIILPEIPLTNKGGHIRFISEDVTTSQSAIKKNFDDAIASANSAKDISGNMDSDWQSIAGATNVSELISGFNKVVSALELLKSLLDKAISDQAASTEFAENTINFLESIPQMAAEGMDVAQDSFNNFINSVAEGASQTWEQFKKDVTGTN